MTQRRFAHVRSEDGIALVVAIILMAFMLSMGLAAIELTDTQSKLTSHQRQRETSFNIAEAALNAQVTQIAHRWIGQDGIPATAPKYTTCPGGSFCPNEAELTAMVPSADTRSGNAPQWQTQVIDNTDGLETHFADSRVGNQCGCDADGDGKIWVRAQATVRGRVRAIVSLVQQQVQAESVPHAAIIAGALTISNNGQHGGNFIIDTNGGLLAVRCDPPGWHPSGTPVANEDASTPCMGQPEGLNNTKTEADWISVLDDQVEGFSGRVTGYQQAPVFAQDQVNRFIAKAQAQGKYYTSCPSSLSGEIVVIDVVGECSYQGNTEFNTAADPGFLILLNAKSSLSLGGSAIYHGVVYHANMGVVPNVGSATQSTGTLITLSGNSRIVGGVLIDGPGRIDAGSSAGANAGSNIEFDDHGYSNVTSYAGAGIIQNSWREIQPGA
jgi:Tfp pilus assembly protein PilX